MKNQFNISSFQTGLGIKSKYYLLLIMIVLNGCSKKREVPDIENGTPRNLVLIYIAGNNDLKLDAINSFEKIKKGYTFNANNRVLIFLKSESSSSYLLTLGAKKTDTLVKYGTENSSDPNFMKKVIADSRSKYKAEKIGMVLWSHATSWKPALKTKSFGQDRGSEMDVRDLARVLPKDLEFMIFDACTMGSVEVLYELRNNAKYIMASPAEILSTSFPYQHITDQLFNGVDGLKKIATDFIKYYEKETGLFQSATISLIQTDKLKFIADETSKLLDLKTPSSPFNKDLIQKLTFDTSNNVPSFDFSSFLQKNFSKSEAAVLGFKINEAVIIKGNTHAFLGNEIDEFCGLSIYLPKPSDPNFSYYSSLQWSLDSRWDRLFR